MLIISVDIGVHNLGWCWCEIDDKTWDPKSIVVKSVGRRDITNHSHINVSRTDCCLYHDNNMVDYVLHFKQDYGWMFDQSDLVMVERQPPGGFINIQDLFTLFWRDKIKLVNPVQIHSFFSMRNLDYEQRKVRSMSLASKYIGGEKEFILNTRKHDMADAMLSIIWWVSKHREVYLAEQKRLEIHRRRKEMNLTCIEDLDRFRMISK